MITFIWNSRTDQTIYGERTQTRDVQKLRVGVEPWIKRTLREVSELIEIFCILTGELHGLWLRNLVCFPKIKSVHNSMYDLFSKSCYFLSPLYSFNCSCNTSHMLPSLWNMSWMWNKRNHTQFSLHLSGKHHSVNKFHINFHLKLTVLMYLLSWEYSKIPIERLFTNYVNSLGIHLRIKSW